MISFSKTPRGFTLIEILVSTAIFSVVIVIALGALLAMSSADRRAEAIKAVLNNLDFAVDSMSRATRTGTGWGCAPAANSGATAGTNCQSGGNEIVFTPSGSATQVAYRLDSTNGSICGQTTTIGCLERSTDGGATWIAITAPEVVICDLSSTPSANCPWLANASASYVFDVLGAKVGAADEIQPKMVITLTGYVKIYATTTTATTGSTFHMQTAVTQRLYDQ